ncbi:MAG: HAMP domain-containing sensor histidine kinase, partial [Patescibacteria group bacterium]
FSHTNLELIQRNKELDEMIKIMVSRDLDLSRANKELLDLDELKSHFVSTAAHQLRTPLTGLKWSLNELIDPEAGGLNEEQEKIVNDMISANNRLIDLVNNLLDLSRLEEGREVFTLKKQDIILILENVCDRFQKIADEKGIELTLEKPPESMALTVDKEKFIIAVSDIVENAIKYTFPGGRVLVRIIAGGKELNIEVSDTGIGIPAKDLKHIFNRFFRASNAVSLETYGTGLGLSVAKEIVEKHNGSIAVESEEGQGTKVTITLPLV